MKRIYNDIPLASVLYTVGGLQKLRLIDANNEHEAINDVGETVFEGDVKDAHKVLHWKYEYAKVRGIKAVGDVLQITLYTKYEAF